MEGIFSVSAKYQAEPNLRLYVIYGHIYMHAYAVAEAENILSGVNLYILKIILNNNN
jgi:hypothetical protein